MTLVAVLMGMPMCNFNLVEMPSTPHDTVSAGNKVKQGKRHLPMLHPTHELLGREETIGPRIEGLALLLADEVGTAGEQDVSSIDLIPNLLSSQEAVNSKMTQTWLDQVSAEISAYEREKGDFPPSTFPRKLDPKPSKTNMGVESLLIALMPADGSYLASGDYGDRLGNTDGDDSKKPHSRFKSSDVFELCEQDG